jgi:4-amino-4-deoxy-L-arabinose transferase-like glycosyltransferase
LLIFIILGAWYSVTIPLGEGPDELPHFTVIRYIVRHGRLPDTPAEHQAFQPPLYYLVGAALTCWIDTSDFVSKSNADYDAVAPDAPKLLLLHTRAEAFPWRGWALAWHLLRLGSLLMGAVTIIAIYRTARLIVNEHYFAMLAAMSVAFLPSFIFMSAIVNNDNLTAMCAALLSWRIVALVARSTDEWNRQTNIELVGLGVLLGCGLLSKLSMIAFAPTMLLALVFVARFQRWHWRKTISALLIVLSVAALVSGGYFIRNLVVFQDILAWPLVLSANAVRVQPLGINEWLDLLGRLYRSFWLEWIGIQLDAPLLWWFTLLTLLAIGGIARGLWLMADGLWRMAYGGWRIVNSRLLKHRFAVTLHVSRFTPHASLIALALVHLAIITVSWIRWSQTVLGTGQARLGYPALPILIIALALGLRAIEQNFMPRLTSYLPLITPYASRFTPHTLHLTLVASLFAVALITPLRYLAPTYAPAPRIAALPASAQPIRATFKDKMRLIGWELSATQAKAGDTLQLWLYWEALKDLTDDDWLKLQLLDVNDRFLWFKDGSPSAGRDSTDSWQRGEKIASLHRIVIPADAPRGVYRLTVGVHPYGRKNWFPIDEENMWIALSDQLVLTELVIE